MLRRLLELFFVSFTNPFSPPPSAPVQRRLQGPPAKSNFLAVSQSVAVSATPFRPHSDLLNGDLKLLTSKANS